MGGRRFCVLWGTLLAAAALASATCDEGAPGCEWDEVQDQAADEMVQLQTRSTGLAPSAAHNRIVERGRNSTNSTIPDKVASRNTSDRSKGLNKQEVMKHLERQGFFLGASRDFWIVMSMSLGCALTALISVLCVSNSLKERMSELRDDDLRSKDFSEALGTSIPEPAFRLSALQRHVLRGEENAAFARTADCAFRGAVLCTACTLPFYLPAFAWFNEQGWSMQYVVVIVAFTLYKDLGTTMSLAWYNFFGTVVPIINTLALYAFYPDGTTTDGFYSTTWFIGAADLVIFCGLILALNVPLGVRMFALSWQAYWSMCFLDPADTTSFSIGFRLITLKGATIGPLAGTIIGVLLSVLVMLRTPFGPCLSCLRGSLEVAMDLAWQEGQLWKDIIADFTGRREDSRIVQFRGKVLRLEGKLGTLSGYLGSTWWESFGVGHPGRAMRNLKELAGKFASMQDYLSEGSLRTLDFGPGPDHEKLLEPVKAKMLSLADKAAQLLYRAARVGAAGGLRGASDRERDALQQGLQAVTEGQRELVDALAKARAQVHGSAFNEGAVPENCMALAFSAYCLQITQYTRFLLDDVEVSEASPLAAFWATLKESCRLNEPHSIARNCIAFFGCFVVGFCGLRGAGPKAQYFTIQPLDSTIAGTTAFLMSAEGKGGSALLKNIGRFLGTGGGTLIGAMIFHALVDCTWHGVICGIISMGVLMFFSFNLYFTSAQYGYVGLLLAAYGGQRLLTPCGATDQTEAWLLQTIANQFLAIVGVTLAEVIIPNTKSSDIAIMSFTGGYTAFLASMRAYMGVLGEGKPSPAKNGASQKLLEAKEKGAEAFIEPRIVRTPWRGELWDRVLDATMHMNHAMNSLASIGAPDDSASPSPFRQALAASDALAKTGGDLARRAEESFQLAVKILTHDDERPLGLPDDTHERLFKNKQTMSDWKSSMKDAIRKAATGAKVQPDAKNATEDGFCQASMSLMMMGSVVDNFSNLEDAILQLPEVTK
jgi:hypothetical protein